MIDPRVTLKNPWLAALLAYLVPGAGHWYQGRHVKGTIYFVCIMGIMIWGCALGEAKAVHLRWDKPHPGVERQRTLGFLAQAGVGVVAIPALLQFSRERTESEQPATEQTPGQLIEELDTEFTGLCRHEEIGNGNITGRLTGKVVVGQYGIGAEFEGRFVGKLNDSRDVDFQIFGSRNANSLSMGPRVTGLDNVTLMQKADRQDVVFSADRRRFYVHITAGVQNMGDIEGTIPRALVNRALAPLSDDAMKHLHGRLGKLYELALVYTWIAGLLNVLAIWDALYGPAYGYGDETEEVPAPPDKPEATGPVAATAVTNTEKVPS